LLPATTYAMENFKLKEGEEFIPLKDLIKILGWVDTGGEAMTRIDNQEIKVNGKIETQRRKKIRSGDVITYRTHNVTVTSH
jgi:ribosome-associated protein